MEAGTAYFPEPEEAGRSPLAQQLFEVKGVTFEQMVAIKKKLSAMKGVKEVRRKWQKPNATFEIVTTDGAEKFSEKLAESTWPGFSLEIEDQKFNTITASAEKSSGED